MILFFICALIAAGIGYGFIRARRSRLEKAVLYTGTLVGVQEKLCRRGGMAYKVVKPTVKYDNGKREVVAEYHDWIRAVDFHCTTGELIEIRAYPELPRICYLAEDDDHVSYEAIVCFSTAGAFAVVGVLSIICFGF